MYFNIRMDGRIEFVCKHGVGHTIWVPVSSRDKNTAIFYTHTCDSCCSNPVIRSIKNDIKDMSYMEAKEYLFKIEPILRLCGL